MESKTKHRLIGAAVLVGLGVILFPFFQHNKGLNQTAEISQAPTFPEKTIELASQSQNEVLPSAPEVTAEINNEISPADANDLNNASIKTASYIENPAEPLSGGMTGENPYNRAAANETPSAKPSFAPEKPVDAAPAKAHKNPEKKKTTAVTTQNIPKPALHNGLYEYNHPAWVIQIGSFNEKENAIRLVNKLRSHGYPAFMQDVKTLVGESTRVFVGPENKQAKARLLASKIESNLKLRGVIISYKPLAV